MLYITVNLFGRNGTREEFEEYENKALKIFRRYGGEIIIAYIPVRNSETDDIPNEIHVLKIENRERFETYLKDPDRLKMAEERNSVIKRTDIFMSEEIINYSD